MTLKEKLADIDTLLRRIETGWREKNIFADPDVDYLYPRNRVEDFPCELNGGWATICVLLADLLGLTKFGEIKETKEYTGSSLRNYMSPNLSQQDVVNLIWAAEDFLVLMGARERKVEEQSE